MCTQTTVLRSGRSSRHRLHSSRVLRHRRPQVSFSVIARLHGRSRTAFATRPSRSSCWPLTASAPACQIPSVKQTQSTSVDTGGNAFFEYRPYPQVCTHEVHGWELKSGRAGGIGDNQQLVVRGQPHSPTGQLVMRVARVPPKRGRCFNSKGTSFHVVLDFFFLLL